MKDIEHTVEVLGNVFRNRFPDMQSSDLEQEVRLHAWEAVQKGAYDPARSNLGAFLFAHCKNRLLNRVRDLISRNDPPCKQCASGEACRPDGVCKAYQRWATRQKSKSALMRPLDMEHVSDVNEPRMKCRDTVEEVGTQELLDLIDEWLPIELRSDYLRMRAGVKLPFPRRSRVQAAVRDILGMAAEQEEGKGQPQEPDVDVVSPSLRLRFWGRLLVVAQQKTDLHGFIALKDTRRLSAPLTNASTLDYVITEEDGAVELSAGLRDFTALAQYREEIDFAFGGQLDWLLSSQRISLVILGGFSDESTWPVTQDAMIDAMVRLHAAVQPYLTALAA